MIKGNFMRSYKKASPVNGQPANTIFVYVVKGTDDELIAYEEAQGTNYRQSDDGEPLFFTTRFGGNNVDLAITAKGRVVCDMSKYDQAASLASQYGGNFGQEIAKAMASQLVSFGSPAQSSLISTTPKDKEPAGDKVD